MKYDKRRLKALERQLRAEIATVLNDITYPASFDTIRNPDPVLLARAGAKGVALYDEVEHDAHARAALTKRKMMAASANWDILPASDKARDVAAAELVRENLKKLPTRKLFYDMLDSILKGFTAGEAMWAIDGSKLTVTGVRMRDQRRFTFGTDYEPRLLVPQQAAQGIALPKRKFVIHTFDGKNRNPYGNALGAVLWFLVRFKKEVHKYWLSNAERFGAPTAVAYVPENYSEAEQDAALAAAELVHSEAAVAISKEVQLELLESKRANDTTIHDRLIAVINDEISKAVLLQSGTMSMGQKGSYAASQTFAGFEKLVAQFDADMLAETINDTLVRWIVEVNMPGAGLPRLVFDLTDEADLTERAKRDGLIMGLGFKPTLEYIQKTYGSHWEEAPAGAPAQLPPSIAGNFNGGTAAPAQAEPANVSG